VLRSIPVFFAVFFVFSLAGCGGSSTNGNDGGSSQTEMLYAAYYTPNGGGTGGHIVPMRIELKR
jgi:hypothetical protein